MKEVLNLGGILIESWIKENDIDTATFDQLQNLSNLPFAFHHIAFMPDGHLGYGMPIGAVLASQNVIVPHAVGADIGCGMSATCLDLQKISKEQLLQIKELIKIEVPVGTSRHAFAQPEKYMPASMDFRTLMESGLVPKEGIVGREFKNAQHQLGTLGGGNHFIEIQKGSDTNIWFMLHSGSRNLGYQIGNHYNKVARELNEFWYSSVPKSHDLAFLPVNSKPGEEYMKEMEYAVYYARLNRAVMQQAVLKCFKKVLGDDLEAIQDYDIAHNYACTEHHFGKNILIHRKGATAAYPEQIGIIPGSQGSNSYIVKGLGNKHSFMSCSHGAGRLMGRNQAKKVLNLEEEQAKLAKIGVLHDMKAEGKLDEAPGAYKDIKSVMADQEDLVEIMVELTPLAVVKG